MLLTLFAGMVCAQPTFTKMYQSSTSYTFDLNELPGGSIFTCMGATHLLDAEGYIDHSSYYHSGGTYLTQTLKPVSENVFCFTTSTVPVPCPSGSGSVDYPVLGKMDSMGSVLTMRRYELNSGPCYHTPGGLEVTGDAGAITWGRDHDFFALRADAALEQVWCKRIYRSGGFRFIKELPGGDLLAGINMDTAGVVLARMNANGDFLWAKSYIRPKGMVHDVLIESDSSFIIIGYTDSMETTGLFDPPPPPSFQPKLFMMKLDGEGEVQWCRGWKSPTNLWYIPQKNRIERTQDGNYVILANLGEEQDHWWFRPFLMKTDLNGDTIWTRSVGRGDYAYITQDLLPNSDGGFLISGIIYGDMPNSSSSLNTSTRPIHWGISPAGSGYIRWRHTISSPWTAASRLVQKMC
ncbi:MAG: hypothetical protein IPL52_12085 [Flavobacteriales bacterium]|nr:hypothetical protein [Flavobacteriales bacterium]